MNYEYRNHVKGMIPSLVPYFAMLVVGFVIWDFLVFAVVLPVQRELSYIENSGYSYVVESSNEYDTFVRMKKLDNIVTFTNSNGKRQNINTYIPLYFEGFDDFGLREGEIGVSEKMAEKLGLSVGSIVAADFPIYDQPIEYKVKILLPYASDLYNVMQNQDFSFALVGDDGSLVKKAKGTVVYFLDAKGYNEYLNEEYSYINRYDLSNEEQSLSRKAFVYYGLMTVIMLLLTVMIRFPMQKEVDKEVLKYYYDGFEIQFVRQIDRKDHFLFYGLPVIGEMIWIAVGVCLMKYSMPFFAMIEVLLALILIINIFAGGWKYGKAN